MSIFTWIKEKFKMLFKTDAEKAFNVNTYLSTDMENAIQLWKLLENGKLPWMDEDVRTIRFSNTVARELASLITQNIDINVQKQRGTDDKALFIQNAIDKDFLQNVQANMEKVIRLGGIMAKWNGSGIDYLTPDRFLVTEFDSNGNITGCIFFDYHTKEDKHYTREEWHRYDSVTRTNEETGETEQIKVYHISNKAFVSDNKDDIGREIPLSKTKWSDIEPETSIEGLKEPLFSYLKNPFSNTIDPDSPLGVSSFSECIEELRWLDIAMSNLGIETEDSKPMMFVDNSAITYAQTHSIKLPRFIQGLDMGVTPETTVRDWTPTMQVTSRVEAINFYLNIISAKIGFSQGYFSFDDKSGTLVTATQVESDDRRTVNLIMTYRKLLDRPCTNGDGRIGFIHDLAYIIDTMATVNGDFPPTEYENYELFAEFADPTENPDEDRQRAYQLMIQGIYPKWYYLVHYEGFTEEDAKAVVEAAKAENQSKGLFDEE